MITPARLVVVANFTSMFQLKQYQLKLIVYNPEQERIERWIN